MPAVPHNCTPGPVVPLPVGPFVPTVDHEYVTVCISRMVNGEAIFEEVLLDMATGLHHNTAGVIPASEIVSSEIGLCPCEEELDYGHPACVQIGGQAWNVNRVIDPLSYWDMDQQPPTDVTALVTGFFHDGPCRCNPPLVTP